MLAVERQGPVLRLKLNRPEARNAFNSALAASLTEAFEGPAREARAVVLSGEGKVFCAGGDLNWMRQAALLSPAENEAAALRLARLFDLVADCPAVVISRVHGAAYGGGCGLAAASDVCLAQEGTQFCFSEARLGLVPAVICRSVLPKIGPGHARALFSTALPFDAARALQIGLVHEVLSAEGLDERVETIIDQVLSIGPTAAAGSKRAALHPPASAEEAAALLSRVRATPEAREGISAFLEKRPASFVHRRS